MANIGLHARLASAQEFSKFLSSRLMVMMFLVLAMTYSQYSYSKEQTAAEKRGYMLYDEYKDPEALQANGRGYVFRKDENIYGYQEQYLTRYRGMPKRWVEPELKGALGVAWRYEEDDLFQCGYDGEAKNCKRVSNCKVELYFHADETPKWQDAELYNSESFRERSIRFLIPQSESDVKYRKALLKKHHGVLGQISYRYQNANNKKRIEKGYVTYYDLEYDIDTTNARLDVPCSVARDAKADTDVEIRLFSETDNAYKVILPASYIKRVKAYLSEKPAEVTAFDEAYFAVGDVLDGDYETWFTEAGWEKRNKEGLYLLDPNIWVYTKDFAKRFGMPEKWVTDEIKPADALAFRVTRQYSQKCGYGGVADACTQNTDRMLDVFINNDRPIQWNDYYKSFDFRTRAEPNIFNSGLDRNIEIDRKMSRKYTELINHVPNSKFYVEYEQKNWLNTKTRSFGAYNRYYSRLVYEDLNLLGVSLAYFEGRKNITNPRFVVAKIDSMYWKDKKSGPDTFDFEKYYDVYPMTDSFMQRIKEYVKHRKDDLDGLWNIVKSQLDIKE